MLFLFLRIYDEEPIDECDDEVQESTLEPIFFGWGGLTFIDDHLLSIEDCYFAFWYEVFNSGSRLETVLFIYYLELGYLAMNYLGETM